MGPARCAAPLIKNQLLVGQGQGDNGTEDEQTVPLIKPSTPPQAEHYLRVYSKRSDVLFCQEICAS